MLGKTTIKILMKEPHFDTDLSWCNSKYTLSVIYPISGPVGDIKLFREPYLIL